MLMMSKILKTPTLRTSEPIGFAKKMQRLNKIQDSETRQEKSSPSSGKLLDAQNLPDLPQSISSLITWCICGECPSYLPAEKLTLVPLPGCSHSSGHTLRGCNACATARPAITDAAARGNVLRGQPETSSTSTMGKYLWMYPRENFHVP